MNPFQELHKKILPLLSSAEFNELSIDGLSVEQWLFFLNSHHYYESDIFKSKDLLITCANEEQSENIFEICKSLSLNHELLFIPDYVQKPYSGILSSENDLLKVFYALGKIVHADNNFLVITSVNVTHFKLPPPNLFLNNTLKLEICDVLGPDELAKRLVKQGYSYASIVENPGTFCKK